MLKPEPPYEHTFLLATLRRSYGIEAQTLAFVPYGFVSTGYVVECATGERYFLKVWNQSRWGKMSSERLDFYLPLTERLVEFGLNIPRFLRTTGGAVKARAGDLTLALFEYLDGKLLYEVEDRPAWIPAEIARALARLHQVTGAVGMSIPDVERFQPAFRETLATGLRDLEDESRIVRPGQERLRALLLPERERLRAFQARMAELGERARAHGSPFVLCHTDLHDMNLYLTRDHERGRERARALYLLDWEGVKLAPAEHDLFMYAGAGLEAFLDDYLRAFGPAELHAETFGYYFYHRTLEDLSDWVYRILYENATDQEDALDLEGLQEDTMAGWLEIEQQIERVRVAIG